MSMAARVWRRSRERAEMLEHIALTEETLSAARAEAAAWRAGYEAMVAANQAMASQLEEGLCRLALHDCTLDAMRERLGEFAQILRCARRLH